MYANVSRDQFSDPIGTGATAEGSTESYDFAYLTDGHPLSYLTRFNRAFLRVNAICLNTCDVRKYIQIVLFILPCGFPAYLLLRRVRY